MLAWVCFGVPPLASRPIGPGGGDSVRAEVPGSILIGSPRSLAGVGGSPLPIRSPLIEQPCAHRGEDDADDEPRANLWVRGPAPRAMRVIARDQEHGRQRGKDVLGGHQPTTGIEVTSIKDRFGTQT